MAITWESKITPINIATKEASIRVVRTDDTDPDNPVTYEVPRAKIGNQAQRLAVCDELWAKHQAKIAEDTTINNFVSALETLCKSNLEARE